MLGPYLPTHSMYSPLYPFSTDATYPFLSLLILIATNARIENSKKSLQNEFAIQRKKMAETRDDRGTEIAEVRNRLRMKLRRT